MNRIAKGALVILAAATMASASAVTCPAPEPGVPMNAVGLTAYCGGITFSNFQVVSFGKRGDTEAFRGSFDVSDKWVSLSFNSSTSGTQAVRLLPQMGGDSPEALGADRARSDETVRARACNAGDQSPGRQDNLCQDNSTLLANFIAVGGTPGSNQAQEKVPASKGVWVAKGVSDPPDSPGRPSSVGEESPNEGSDVPEPAAFLLAGPALLGVLALRRKSRKA